MTDYPKSILITVLICLTMAVVMESLHHKGPVADSPTAPAQLMNVSAYCPCEKCCGKADGYTASGVPAVGKIVAAPKGVAFGTVLDIPGYSPRAVVQDRGGAITGNKLDVLMETHQEALNWGRQYLKVRIVE